MRLYQVTASYFCAGIEVDDSGIIMHSAPILAWSRGKTFHWFSQYCVKKGWSVNELPM